MRKFYALIFTISQFAFIAQTPVIGPINGPASACSQPGFAVFSATASNNPTQFNWFTVPSAGVVINSPTLSSTSISFPFYGGLYTVYCTASNSFGTSNPAQRLVNVTETPAVTFSGSDLNICEGASTTLMASSTMQSSSSTLQYNWSPSSSLDNSSSYRVIATPKNTTTYTVFLTYGNCTNEAAVTVSVSACVGLQYFGEQERPSISVFPNPSNGKLVLRTSKSQEAVILDLTGKQIRSLELKAGIDQTVSGLAPGSYFIIGELETFRVVVKSE